MFTLRLCYVLTINCHLFGATWPRGKLALARLCGDSGSNCHYFMNFYVRVYIYRWTGQEWEHADSYNVVTWRTFVQKMTIWPIRAKNDPKLLIHKGFLIVIWGFENDPYADNHLTHTIRTCPDIAAQTLNIFSAFYRPAIALFCWPLARVTCPMVSESC